MLKLKLQCVAVVTVTKPVTQTEVVEVNSASIKLVHCPVAEEIGNVKRNAPVKITKKNPIATSLVVPKVLCFLGFDS